MTEVVIDASVLLRHLTGEPPDLAERARAVLAAAERAHVRLVVTALTLAEVVWVLQHSYRWRRGAIADGLARLILSGAFSLPEASVISQALTWYRMRPRLHFADAYIAAVAAGRGAAVVSLDRDLKRLRDVTVVDSSAAFEQP